MPHTEQRRRVSSGVTAHTAHHAHTRGHGHGLKRSASNVSTAALAPTGGGGNGGTGTAAMRGLSTMTGVRPPAQRQNSGKTDDGASSGNGTAATGKPHHHKSSLSLSRRKTSGQGDEVGARVCFELFECLPHLTIIENAPASCSFPLSKVRHQSHPPRRSDTGSA